VKDAGRCGELADGMDPFNQRSGEGVEILVLDDRQVDSQNGSGIPFLCFSQTDVEKHSAPSQIFGSQRLK
ncbi:MAG: hypothetical protein ACT4P5_14205, partial [Armatimonadota bacterium]